MDRGRAISWVLTVCAGCLFASPGGYDGNLFDYPVRKGVCKLLRGVEYRKTRPVAQNVV